MTTLRPDLPPCPGDQYLVEQGLALPPIPTMLEGPPPELPPEGMQIPPEVDYIGPAPGWAPTLNDAPPVPDVTGGKSSARPFEPSTTVCLRHCAHYMETHDDSTGELADIGRPLVDVSRTCLRMGVPIDAPVFFCTQYEPILPSVLRLRARLGKRYEKQLAKGGKKRSRVHADGSKQEQPRKKPGPKPKGGGMVDTRPRPEVIPITKPTKRGGKRRG